MRLIPPLLQIAMLALGFASNRADAMAGAAAFAELVSSAGGTSGGIDVTALLGMGTAPAPAS